MIMKVNKRKLIILSVGALLLFVAGLVVVVNHSMRSELVVIPDVTRVWQQHFSKTVGPLLSSQLLIIVRGHIDGSAKVSCAGMVINLSPGDINSRIAEGDYYLSACDVRYEPSNVTTGYLSVRVIIGETSDWKYTRPDLFGYDY